MATYTSEQLATLFEEISTTKFTSNQFGKKVERVKKVLDKRPKEFDKVLNIFRPSLAKANGLKKPLSSWLLFVDDYRKNAPLGTSGKGQTAAAKPVWAKMTEEEKKPFVEESKRLSAEYKKAKEALMPSDKDVSSGNEVLASDNEKVLSSSDEKELSSDDEKELNDAHSDSDGEDNTKTKKTTKKKTKADTKSKSKKELLEEFEDLMDRDMIRYENDDGKFFEYAIDGNRCLIREGTNKDDTKFKYTPKVMKSDKAVVTSIDKLIAKNQANGYELVC